VTEIRAQVDLDHPVELVWRALTEPPLLARWFVEADIRPRVGAAFRLRAPSGEAALAGFDPTTLAEVTAVDPPRKLVMRWRSEQLQTLVTWDLEPVAGGCRLVVTQIGFLGVRGTERRAALKATYERLYGERLPAVLAELAGGPPAALAPLVPGAARASRLSTVRGGRWLAVAGVAAVIAAVGTALSGVLPSRTADPVEARPGADRAPLAPAAQPTSGVPILPSSPAPGSTRPTSARPSSPPARVAEGTPVAPAPGAAPSAVAPVATLPGPAALGAAYRTINPGVLGLAAFRGGITVRNSGGTRAGEWAVAVTMPAAPSAATVPFVKNGTTYTFSGGPLAPGEAVEFTYDVLLNLSLRDPSPTACSIGDAGCEGV
jgi:uncharacterized protein YndB with AHSA1/START domain